MVLENIPSSILLIDRTIRVVSANRNFIKKSRRSLEETIGQKLEAVFPRVILKQLNFIENITDVFETGISPPAQRMYYRAPGLPLRYYYYRFLPVLWENRVENVMLLMEDITEQVLLGQEMQRLQKHLASVVDSASDIVISTDSRGRLLSWNHAAERVTGLTFHQVEGSDFKDIIVKADQERIKEIFQQVAEGTVPELADIHIVTDTGEPLLVSWKFSPLQSNPEGQVGVVAVGRDLSQQKLMEQRLVQSEKLASLGVMAGGIAHEIRNPLAICSSAAQLLMDSHQDEMFHRDCAEKIYRNVNKASTIIDNLLNFSRITPGVNDGELDLTTLLQEVMLLARNQAALSRVQLLEPAEKKPFPVRGNSSLLEQLFLNLILNGIRAMPQGGTLSISLEKTNKSVKVAIEDTGIGIPEKNLAKIFDPFFTTAPAGEGTGLGLALCYAIARQHGGDISVASSEGEGATFTVTLPVDIPHQ